MSDSDVSIQVSDQGIASIQTRTLRTLIASQLLAGVGLVAGITVGALIVQELFGATAYAGVPAAFYTLGAAGAAIMIGRLSQSRGRRIGLALGYAAGAIGAAGVVLSVALHSLPLLFLSLFVYGSGTAANFQARYAGADLAPVSNRGKAISFVLLATTFGAMLGPNLVDVGGRLAHFMRIHELAGPFVLATFAFGLAGAVVLMFMRPDPLLTARALHKSDQHSSSVSQVIDKYALRIGAGALIIAQMVMIAIMTMTPVHMLAHGHALSAAGIVISAHIAGMFLPSIFTGILVDRFGHHAVIVLGSFTLLCSGVLSAIAPVEAMLILTIALALLGIGWNFMFVAGTAMVTNALPIETRARMQGRVDFGASLAGAAGGIGSGFMYATAGFSMLSLAGGVLALCILPLLLASGNGAGAFPKADSEM